MKIAEKNIRKALEQEITTILRHAENADKFWPYKKDISYNDFLENKLLMILLIREGIPYSLFSLIQDYTPFSEKDWSVFLDISTKSLHRYKMSPKHFKPIHSEKIIEMAEVTKIGLDTFGDIEKFRLWLDTPNFALGSLKPMDLLRDSYGKEMVVGELTRINYGIFA